MEEPIQPYFIIFQEGQTGLAELLNLSRQKTDFHILHLQIRQLTLSVRY